MALTGPEHRRRQRQRWLFPALLIAAGLAAAAGADPEPPPALVRLYYEYEVTIYCSLSDRRVQAGFRHLEGIEMARSGPTAAEIDEARRRAWLAAYREWQNRGLGGFRNWCRTEAAEAAERLGSAAPEG
jgi:hypothetical protein